MNVFKRFVVQRLLQEASFGIDGEYILEVWTINEDGSTLKDHLFGKSVVGRTVITERAANAQVEAVKKRWEEFGSKQLELFEEDG